MFKRVNLHRELQKEKERAKLAEDTLLADAKYILDQADAHDRKLHERILQSGASPASNFHLPSSILHVQQENIFTTDQIRTICSRYRLRFLETKHLRYPLPYEAYIRIKEFEKQQQAEIQQFSIMAPAEAFRLDKKTDPLLFAHLGNNRYYLLHQWGNDLAWWRKIVMLPLRNLYCLIATIIMMSFAIAFFLPKEWIVYDERLYPLLYNFRLFLFFIISTGSFGLLLYIGLTRNKRLSEDEWNSKWM